MSDELLTQMDQMTDRPSEMARRGASRLRTRGKRMRELATRAYCEQNYDFARLLTQLATEVFAHAKDVEESDVEESYAPCRVTSANGISAARRR